jgi:hypothetical protein
MRMFQLYGVTLGIIETDYVQVQAHRKEVGQSGERLHLDQESVSPIVLKATCTGSGNINSLETFKIVNRCKS